MKNERPVEDGREEEWGKKRVGVGWMANWDEKGKRYVRRQK